MIGDFGRETTMFGQAKNYEGLNVYSGRAITASDMNEESHLQKKQREEALIDVIGHVGVPKQGGGFRLRNRINNTPLVTSGDMYVHGARFIQDEAHGLARFLFDGFGMNTDLIVVAKCFKLAEDYLREPFLRDPALGGPDTSGRRRATHQLQVFRLGDLATANDMPSNIAMLRHIRAGNTFETPLSAPRDGRAGFALDPAHVPADDDCMIHEDANFSGQTNYNYRVEIHQVADSGAATFKWAREDVRARVVPQPDGSWALEGLPTDDHRALAVGQTVELISANTHARNEGGRLGTITSLASDGTVTFSAEIAGRLDQRFGPFTITRWDHTHAGNEQGIPIGTNAIAIEKGIEIRFAGRHLPGDFWHCAARVVTGDILWPPVEMDVESDGLVRPFNWGPYHVALGRVRRINADRVALMEDLLPTFPELTNLTADDVTVSDTGCTDEGQTVQQALEDLCARITDNVCRIRVRPDRLGERTLDVHPDWGRLPTLGEAVERLVKILDQLPARSDDRDEIEAFVRSVSIEFTSGEYVWPDDLNLMAYDLIRFSLQGCTEAAVRIDFRSALTLERCMNVAIKDLNIKFTQPETGLYIAGGKSVRIDNVQIRQPISKTAAVLTVQAKRRIKLTDTRILVDDSRPARGLRPALHIWDADAQTHLDGVSSNGALILGALLPEDGDNPAEALVSGAENGSISGAFSPVNKERWETPTLSQNTCRIVGCRFQAVVPGQVMSDALATWSKGSANRRRNFGFRALSFSPSMVAGMFGTRDARFKEIDELVRNGTTLRPDRAPVFDFTAREVKDRVTSPFRHLDVVDSEILKGPSILVGETVSLRNTRFPQWDMRSTRAGFRLFEGQLPAFLFDGLDYIARQMNRKEYDRPWRPVCLVVAKVASIGGNAGNPNEMHSNGEEWPLVVDFSPPNERLTTQLELTASLPDMIRHKCLVFHRKYIERG